MGVPKCCGQETCSENDIPSQNDKRCQLINEVRSIIDDIEHGQKTKPRQSRRPDRGVPGMRDLEDTCKQWRKRRDCTPPLITTIALHETRPTSDYSNMRHENSSQVTYKDATKEGQEFRKVPPAPWDLPRSPSQELRAGNLYTNCRCLKRDGLQYDCQRWECAGRPECVAVNPGPCCVPSQWPKPIRGDKRFGNRKHAAETSGAEKSNLSANFGEKPLRTGPLNPNICIPLGSQQFSQGYPGSTGQGYTGGVGQGHPGGVGQGHPEVVGLIYPGVVGQGHPGGVGQGYPVSAGQRHPGGIGHGQGYPGGSRQEIIGLIAGPPHGMVGQETFSSPQGGGSQPGVVMILDLSQDLSGAGNRPLPQRRGALQETTHSGSGFICECKPTQSEPAHGGPQRHGIVGIPMQCASCPS